MKHVWHIISNFKTCSELCQHAWPFLQHNSVLIVIFTCSFKKSHKSNVGRMRVFILTMCDSKSDRRFFRLYLSPSCWVDLRVMSRSNVCCINSLLLIVDEIIYFPSLFTTIVESFDRIYRFSNLIIILTINSDRKSSWISSASNLIINYDSTLDVSEVHREAPSGFE